MNKELLLKVLRASILAMHWDDTEITVEEECITLAQFTIYFKDENDEIDIFRLTEAHSVSNYPHSPDDVDEELLVQTKNPFELVTKVILHSCQAILDNVIEGISLQHSYEEEKKQRNESLS